MAERVIEAPFFEGRASSPSRRSRLSATRGQLQNANWSGASGGSVSYEYFPDGKVSEQHYGNGVQTGFDYDARGFTRVVHHQSPQGNISHRTYWRDNRDRIIGWRKSGGPGQPNPKENGRGDRYAYDDEGQLYLASYEVDANGNATDSTRTDIFTYDELGNRMGTENHVASRGWLNFKRRNNGLNQYGEWYPYSIIHHDDHFAVGIGVRVQILTGLMSPAPTESRGPGRVSTL